MLRIKQAFAALKVARRHLVAAGAPSDLIADLDALVAKIESYGFREPS